jgi:citrate lyase subunit beta/citryl-CoA lyase
LLFVPGDRPDRIAKAVAAGADGIVVDLEDAVATARKDAARKATAQALATLPEQRPIVTVRINAVQTGMAGADVESLETVLAGSSSSSPRTCRTSTFRCLGMPAGSSTGSTCGS